jgi:hypothetical protein
MNMEAIISRAPANHAEAATPRWLLEAHKLGRSVLRRIGYVLVHYSRAAMLLRGGDRPFRRL